jgi:hypothetical protein
MNLREAEKRLRRLYREADELDRMNHELGIQRDQVAQSIETTRQVVTLRKMERVSAEIRPVRMEIL